MLCLSSNDVYMGAGVLGHGLLRFWNFFREYPVEPRGVFRIVHGGGQHIFNVNRRTLVAANLSIA